MTKRTTNMRLQKYLADCGVCSRRTAETYILAGRVKVNGAIITNLGTKIEPEDEILFDNKMVKKTKYQYIILNKPTGYVSSVKDQFDRKTVCDLIDINERIYPVGRLDYDTSGLLIMTSDGSFAYKLTHPKYMVEKTYIAKVAGKPTKEKLNQFMQGLVIDDYKTAPARIKILESQGKYTLCEIILKEGKNRQVRKMCAKIGHEVIELQRIAIGKITLGNLQTGKWRRLTHNEIQLLKE